MPENAVKVCLHCLEKHCGVVASEAEGVTHRGTDGACFSCVECVVQIELVFPGRGVSGQVDEAVGDRADADDRLDGAGSAEKMAGHGFGGVDRDARGAVA